ncbi:MAG TPA: hypothetical protein VFQ61_31655, partial [Polyangiaceae bacterium]|nr:hypothetical protein [Polyangiaceae bacterium]
MDRLRHRGSKLGWPKSAALLSAIAVVVGMGLGARYILVRDTPTSVRPRVGHPNAEPAKRAASPMPPPVLEEQLRAAKEEDGCRLRHRGS